MSGVNAMAEWMSKTIAAHACCISATGLNHSQTQARISSRMLCQVLVSIWQEARKVAGIKPATLPGCAGDAGKPVPRRVGRSTVRNAGHKETGAARSGETGPVWAERLVDCASVVLRPLQACASNHHPSHRIILHTSQKPRPFRPAPRVQK